MKVWQLAVCLEQEDHIFKQYFGHLDLIEHGRDEVDKAIVVSALSKSTKKMYKDNINYLRQFRSFNTDPVVQIYTILEAYMEFGGNAITEVFDYSSYPLDRLL